MENQVLAGVGNRLVATIIDGIILSIVTLIIAAILGVSAFSAFSGTNGQPSDAAIMAIVAAYFGFILILFVLRIAYFSYFESSERQATPGKIAMKIKVVDENGFRLSLGNAIGRSVSKILSSFICGIGYIMAFFTKDEQALHDMIAKTFVVRA